MLGRFLSASPAAPVHPAEQMAQFEARLSRLEAEIETKATRRQVQNLAENVGDMGARLDGISVEMRIITAGVGRIETLLIARFGSEVPAPLPQSGIRPQSDATSLAGMD